MTFQYDVLIPFYVMTSRNGRITRIVRVVLKIAIVILIILALPIYRSINYLAYVDENKRDLWIAVIKPFEGVPYYVGTKEGYAYFRVGKFFRRAYKREATLLNLPRTFPLGEGEPYPLTMEMFPGVQRSK